MRFSRFLIIVLLCCSFFVFISEVNAIISPPETSFSGCMWLIPYDQSIAPGGSCSTELHVNTGDQNFAAYGVEIYYDSDILQYDSYVLGADGFISAVNSNEPGIIRTTGFDPMGKGPGIDLHVWTINWIAVGTGENILEMIINDLSDGYLIPIGVPTPNQGRVVVAPLDAKRLFSWTTPTGMPGNVTGDLGGVGVVNIQDALMCAQYYVGILEDMPFYRAPSAWYEVHVPFTEVTQETFDNMVYVDKDAALESVKSFNVDFHSKNDNEQGIVWIDDVAIYRDNPTGYREYFTIGNYDELTVGGAWAGGRYFVYNASGGTTPPATIEGEVVAGGPSEVGNCMKVSYNLGAHHDDGEGHDVTSLGIGLDIIYGNPYMPAEVPMGTYLVADVRTFSGIRFWIRLQKSDSTGLVQGFGDEPEPAPGQNLGGYVMRVRLGSADEVISDDEYFNYFGLNIDM